MTVEGVDLELSLGLGGASRSPRLPPLQPNPMLSPVYPPSPFTSLAYERAQWCHLLAPSFTEGRSPGRSPPFPVGIDVNKETEEEEEAGECSPNSNVSAAVSGGGGGNKRREGDLKLERSCPRGTSDEEDGGEGEGSRKKLRLSKEQSAVLEERFLEHNSLDPKQKQALAKQLNLRPRQVEVWFQNRRARSKLKQTEVECGLLRRCCDRMREENRRLQKEAQELRALKLSPPDQLYVDMVTPAATTLSICSSCERVASDAPTQPGAAIPASTTPASPAIDDQHQLQRFLLEQRLHPDLLPRHLPLEHGSPMPVECAGQSLPRVPAHLVSSIDAPPPR